MSAAPQAGKKEPKRLQEKPRKNKKKSKQRRRNNNVCLNNDCPQTVHHRVSLTVNAKDLQAHKTKHRAMVEGGYQYDFL